MKCDELKAITAVDAYEEYENNILDESKHHYYNKQEVDAAIAELKAEIAARYKHIANKLKEKIMKKSSEYFQNWREKLTPEKIDKLKAQRRAAYNRWLKKIKEDPEKAAAEKVRHRAIVKKSFKKRMLENPEKIRARGRAKYAKEKALNSEWYLKKIKYACEYRALQKALNAGEDFNG